jgi:two-component system phosphate regulon sensor histidine kinase PhoR
MRIRVFFNPTAVAVAIGVIVVSTVTMSLVSYRYTLGRENLTETSLVQSNIQLAKQTVDRIEQKIIDNDRVLSDMIDVNEPSHWPAMVEAIKKADLNVQEVYFFRAGGGSALYERLLYPPYESIRRSWNVIRSALLEINVGRLTLNQIHHLHMERTNDFLFMSHVVKQTETREKILVCFRMDADKISGLLNSYLRDLQSPTDQGGGVYVSVVDFENNGVFREPIPRSSKYFYEMRFPTTFYKWILQVVPRNYTELEQIVRNQRRTDILFMVLSVSLIFASLAVIYAASRRELQLRQLKEDFISNVSHELKTPISLIRLFSEMLATGRVKAEKSRQEYY